MCCGSGKASSRQVKPVKRAGGRRYYRPADMQLLGGIKKLLHDDGHDHQGRAENSYANKGLRMSRRCRSRSTTSVRIPNSPATPGRRSCISAASRRPNRRRATCSRTAPPRRYRTPRLVRRPASEPEVAAEPRVAPKADPEPVAADLPEPDAVAATRSEPDPHPAKPTLPSFLQRRTEAPSADPEAAELRARAIDIPEPAAETDQTYTPGTLARLARLDRLDAEQARRIAPLAAELRGWLERHRSRPHDVRQGGDSPLPPAHKTGMNGPRRAMAQPGSASVWGTEGRRFKSC